MDTMKVYANAVINDYAMTRISHALKKYIPLSVQLVNSEDEADLVVIYVYGLRRAVRWHTERLLAKGKKYAIVQMVIRGTPNPKTEDWLPIWQKALVVWSYYNLHELCKEDGNVSNFNFYYAPLGVDSNMFSETKSKKKFIIACGGYKRSYESIHEIISAARSVNENIFHVGTPIYKGEDISHSDGMPDSELAKRYSECEFVSGLRRHEGFEMLVIEGLLCGARPICYDRPHYRHWFGEFAEFISERNDVVVISELIKLFMDGARDVTEVEKEVVKRRFNWKNIAEGFWRKII